MNVFIFCWLVETAFIGTYLHCNGYLSDLVGFLVGRLIELCITLELFRRNSCLLHGTGSLDQVFIAYKMFHITSIMNWPLITLFSMLYFSPLRSLDVTLLSFIIAVLGRFGLIEWQIRKWSQFWNVPYSHLLYLLWYRQRCDITTSTKDWLITQHRYATNFESLYERKLALQAVNEGQYAAWRQQFDIPNVLWSQFVIALKDKGVEVK